MINRDENLHLCMAEVRAAERDVCEHAHRDSLFAVSSYPLLPLFLDQKALLWGSATVTPLP